MQIEMEDFTVEIIRKSVKNLNLRINIQGNVTVSVPKRFPLYRIHSFLQEKKQWITEHRARLQAKHLPAIHQLQSGEFHCLYGKKYQLLLHDALPRQIYIKDDCLNYHINADAAHHDKELFMQRWLAAQMKNLVPDLIRKWEPVLGVQVNQWGIKAMKTRWGSCNTVKKKIWLNLFLIKKPLECLEYVLVHEMVHLLEASHNRRFHALMTQFLPEWKNCKKILESQID